MEFVGFHEKLACIVRLCNC